MVKHSSDRTQDKSVTRSIVVCNLIASTETTHTIAHVKHVKLKGHSVQSMAIVTDANPPRIMYASNSDDINFMSEQHPEEESSPDLVSASSCPSDCFGQCPHTDTWQTLHVFEALFEATCYMAVSESK